MQNLSSITYKFFFTGLLVALLFAFAPTATNAQNHKTAVDLPEGTTLVNLSASERVEVEQDLLVARLQFKAEDDNPKDVQDEINKKMRDVVDAAKKVSSVKVSTQQYYVHEYDRNQGKRNLPVRKVWRGQQGVVVKGKKADELLELVGEIQEMGLIMNGLSYQVSPELLEETREAILDDALIKLMAKANRTAKALGKSNAELKQINIDMGNYRPQPYKLARGLASVADTESFAAPVATPGETNITVSVSAQALLR